MNQKNELRTSKAMFNIPLLFVFTIWFIYWIEIRFGFNFNKYGVLPRSFSGLRGVLCSHFIHSDTKHLFNNTIPLMVLLTSLFYFYRTVALKVLVYGALLTGFFTWVIGRESYHIGASGIVYLLFSFIFFSGIFKQHYRLVAMSLITIFLYGSMIWYILPIEKGMSWEGHLSGFIFGLFFAYVYKNKGIVKEAYIFTKTEFDDYFDENGNYIEPTIEELDKEDEQEIRINVNYVYKENNETE